jgi:hypothetical protein
LTVCRRFLQAGEKAVRHDGLTHAVKHEKGIRTIVVLLAAAYYMGRLAIFYAGVTGSIEFEEEQSDLVFDFVTYSFLAIGVVGLMALPGVYMTKPWGFWATRGVCAYTVAFDLWALALVQPSAAAGIIPAAVIAGYLVITRRDHLDGG